MLQIRDIHADRHTCNKGVCKSEMQSTEIKWHASDLHQLCPFSSEIHSHVTHTLTHTRKAIRSKNRCTRFTMSRQTVQILDGHSGPRARTDMHPLTTQAIEHSIEIRHLKYKYMHQTWGTHSHRRHVVQLHSRCGSTHTPTQTVKHAGVGVEEEESKQCTTMGPEKKRNKERRRRREGAEDDDDCSCGSKNSPSEHYILKGGIHCRIASSCSLSVLFPQEWTHTVTFLKAFPIVMCIILNIILHSSTLQKHDWEAFVNTTHALLNWT